MVATGKLSARGQITLPPEVREAAGLEPGDTVTFRTIGRGTVEMRAVSRLTLADLIERFPITVPVDEAADAESLLDEAMNDSLSSGRV